MDYRKHMNKIFKFEQYVEERDYFFPITNELRQEVNSWVYESLLNEGLVDDITNKLSKTFFGDLSKVSIIDDIRKANLEIEKEIIVKKYEFEDSLDALELKLSEVSRSNNRAAIQAAENEITRKRNEYRTYIKSKKLQMEKGMSILSKAIDKNRRRKEYYEAGKAEDELNLANYEYEMARKKSNSSKEIEKLKRSYEKAKVESRDIINKFQNTIFPVGTKSETIDTKDLSNPDKIKRKLSSKKSSDLLELKRKTADNIIKKKEELAKFLEELEAMVDEYNKSGLRLRDSVLNAKEKNGAGIANEIDAEENLYSVYSSVGKTKEEIERKMEDTDKLRSLFTQINNAVDASRDESSGYTKEISLVFADPTSKNIKQAIKKIK